MDTSATGLLSTVLIPEAAMLEDKKRMNHGYPTSSYNEKRFYFCEKIIF
ncbi:hypothetical protein J2S17_002469 [Cytobacillus purgationiresistens]|uniref:Uncharacterized protein n=1 Tax=Cytobacillus purgationiresistens TaxID=863449 RepID=A0ABU0AH61_9BACI|nr:hypothetical protein [Cytobacillus purgationiresistens]